MKKFLEILLKELGEKSEVLVKFAADLLTSGLMLFLVSKAALLSNSYIEGLVAATHDPLVGAILSVSHVVVLVFDAVAIVWVSFKSLKRFLKSLK